MRIWFIAPPIPLTQLLFRSNSWDIFYSYDIIGFENRVMPDDQTVGLFYNQGIKISRRSLQEAPRVYVFYIFFVS